MDWRTEVKITDPSYGVNTYEISLNKPLSYRGYRFFQSQAIAMGSAQEDQIRTNTSKRPAIRSPIEIPQETAARNYLMELRFRSTISA